MNGQGWGDDQRTHRYSIERRDVLTRKLAQDLLQTNDNDLDDAYMLAMLNIFRKESTGINVFRTYTDLKRDSLRKFWIKRKLQKHGHLPPK